MQRSVLAKIGAYILRTRPVVISILEVGDRHIERDEAGYLIDPGQWDMDVASVLAEEENISLTDEHREILIFMRDYFEEHAIAADARFAFAFLAKNTGLPIRLARTRFFELFPYGYVAQACKIAGMRQPKAWSTG